MDIRASIYAVYGDDFIEPITKEHAKIIEKKDDKKEAIMKKINLCPWCIQGLQSHGMKIFVGDYVEAPCDDCGEEENVHECIEDN